MIIGSDIFSGGTTAPATAPVLVACYARLAPVIVRTATALGAAEAYRATIDHTRATFSRIGGARGEGAGAGKGGGESGPNERIQNTPQDMQKFLNDKMSNGILRKHNDGSYEFIKDFGQLKKGDRLTKDLLHNDFELWSNRGYHKGSVEPKRGTIYKEANPSRQLRF